MITNKTNKNLSISRYTSYMCLVVLSLCGLTLLLASCERIIPGMDSRSGEQVAVNVVMQTASYGAVQSLFRNSNGEESETALISVADNIYMYATLEADPEPKTRGLVALEPNVQLRVAAYKENSTTARSKADYKVGSNGALNLIAGTLSVGTDSTYKFVAYSLNSDTMPAHEETLPVIYPDYDLLWGETTKTITASDRTVSLTMNHKFSLMTITASTFDGAPATPKITGIHNVKVKPGYGVNLKVVDGTFASTTDTAQTMTFPAVAADTAVTSLARTVYTQGNNTTTIEIGSITIEGITHVGPFSIRYNVPLEAGKSYSLRVHFKKGVQWAGSNIYWEADPNNFNIGKLTFDAHGDTKNQDYQGVHFRWGGLAGISPVPSTNLSSRVLFRTKSPYDPNAPLNTSWEIEPMTSSFNSAPVLDVTTSPGNPARDNKYLTELGDSLYNFRRGDICQFLGHIGAAPDGYRMPTSTEFGMAAPYWADWGSVTPVSDPVLDGWRRIGTVPPQFKPDFETHPVPANNDTRAGKYRLSSGASYQGAFFPTSGIMTQDVALNYVGLYGFYWSGSIATGTGTGLNALSYRLEFFSNRIWIGDNPEARAIGPRAYAHPVRCVKKGPGEP